jgi:tRNA pseudouridine(55) synthase
MSNTILSVDKPLGWTPLQLLDHLRQETPSLKLEKLSYAGRLDPMAEGCMVVLVGEANKQRQTYLNLSKIYQFEILFGVATDTYDLLGLVTDMAPNLQSKPLLQPAIAEIKQQTHMPYPPYSSKPVAGKPLWWWAKAGKLSEIEIPVREIEIYNLKIRKIDKVKKSYLETEIPRRLSLVAGDFRQREIITKWAKALGSTSVHEYWLASLELTCGSGVYVRGVVNEISKKLDIPACAFSIKRTYIGEKPPPV